MAVKRSVGLIILISGIPGETEPLALLVRRGELNPEKLSEGTLNESYPGGCQVSAHGRINEGEEISDALDREIKEELGLFTYFWLSGWMDMSKMKFILLNHEVNEKEDATTYGIVVPATILETIHLGPASGGLKLLRRNQLNEIKDLRTFDKKFGVTDTNVVAMFSDELLTVKRAFEKFVT